MPCMETMSICLSVILYFVKYGVEILYKNETEPAWVS